MPEPSVDQGETIEALERLVAATDPPLRRFDTHISHLFLGRSRVYKLKRAVRLPFADFSSPEARQRACQAELAVNKALAPELYEGVLPITRGLDATLSIAGRGQPIDWVVVMRRFADGALFSELAAAGTLGVDLATEAAQVVARFHADSAPNADAGHTADYVEVVDGLRRTEAEGAERLSLSPGSDDLFEGLTRAITRASPLIEQRREAGWVRRGHGDLHLRNLCLFDGRVTPFDALEFDPSLAITDVLYDIGFLLMDLREHDLPAHANAALNAYLDELPQPPSAPGLLPLFMALRAAVRMAVLVGTGAFEEAASYRRLGRELLHPVRPGLLAIGGLSGSGKSTLARALAPRMAGACGARLLRTDVLRQAGAQGPATRYSPEARASVYERLASEASDTLRAGTFVIADATFQDASSRAAIERAAEGYLFRGLWLDVPAALRADRVRGRHGDASEATANVALSQVEPHDLGDRWLRLNGAGPTPALADEALSQLGFS